VLSPTLSVVRCVRFDSCSTNGVFGRSKVFYGF
jgi:hypothetical protein